MTEQELLDVKTANPSAALSKIDLEDGDQSYEFVVVAPSGAQYKRWQEGSNILKGNPVQALAILVYDCVKFPSKAAMAAMFAVKPGLCASVGNELLGLAGVNATAVVTKL